MRPWLRCLALLTLARLLISGPSATSPNPLSGLNARSPSDREHAILLLSEKRNLDLARVVPALTGKLRDPASNVRLAAADVLGNVGPAVQKLSPSAEERLDAMLNDSTNPQGRLAAATALGRIGFHSPATLKLLTATFRSGKQPLSTVSSNVLLQLGAAAKGAVDDLTDMVVDPRAPVPLRHKAGDILATIGSGASAAIPKLAAALDRQSTDEEVQESIAWALGNIGPPPGTLEVLRRRLRTATRPKTLSAIAWALGRMGPQAAPAIGDLFDLTEGHGDDPQFQQARETAAQSIENIADDLSSEKQIGAIPQLEIAARRFERDPDSQIRRSGQSLADTTRYLIYLQKAAAAQDASRRQWQLFARYVWFIAIALLLLAWRFLVSVAPGWVLRRAESLDRWEQTRESPAPRRVRDFFVGAIFWFAFRRRVLNAWISRHSSAAGPQFSPKPPVPLPVMMNGTVCSDLQPLDIRPAFDKPRKRILITGEDKSGKSTLAARIAHWCLEEPQPQHPTLVRMFPVLLPVSSAVAVQSDATGLAAVVQKRLIELLGERFAPPPRLARVLLERRLLIVMDCDLESEGNPSFEDIRTALGAFPGTALMLISPHPVAGERSWDVLQTLRVPPQRVRAVIRSVLSEQGTRLSFSQPELSSQARILRRMFLGGSIPLVAVRMYAKEFYLWRRSGSKGRLPQNPPAIMLLHLEQSIQDSGLSTSDSKPLIRGIQHVAWRSLTADLEPGPIDEQQVEDILRKDLQSESKSTSYATLLFKSGITRSLGAGRLVVTPNMLCEYLAAMYVVETYNEDTCWDTIVGHENRMGNGFFTALWHCAFLNGPAKGIGLSSMQLLARRLQTDTYLSRLEEYRQNVEARRRMQELMGGSLGAFQSARISGYIDVRLASNTSGDFPILVELTDDLVTICLIDIGGHGNEAAERAEKVKKALDQVPDWAGRHPLDALQRADNILREYDEAAITMCLVQVDLKARTLVCASAGMPGPLIFRSRQCIRLFASGIYVGSRAASKVPRVPVEMDIEEGDTLVLFSDGVREALNNITKTEFHERGIIKIVQPLAASEQPDMIARRIFEAVADHTGSDTPQDDLTIAVVRVLN